MVILGKYDMTMNDASCGARWEEACEEVFTRCDGRAFTDSDIDEIVDERRYMDFPVVRYTPTLSTDGLTLTVKVVSDKCN